MSVALLDKTRKINKLIHNSTYEEFDIHKLLDSFEPLVLSDVLIVDADGRILEEVRSAAVNRLFDFSKLNKGTVIAINLLKRIELMAGTRENIAPGVLGFDEPGFDAYFMVCPIDAFEERFGYLFMYRNQAPYDIDDIVLSEYVASTISILMATDKHDAKEKVRVNGDDFRRIIRTLSETELKAAVGVMICLGGESGIVKVADIAKDIGVTRSVVVNSLKKLTTTGIISSKSCGPKGTFIQINNDIVYREIVSLKELIA